jgi:hypothetical protein
MQPQRPAFFEGQILAATDLTLGVEHGRAVDARHARLLHDWGIAAGLTLSEAARRDADDNPYVEVTLAPGVAVDGTGREIVVSAPVRVNEAVFEQVNSAALGPADTFYPVVVQGVDDDTGGPVLSSGRCGPNGRTMRRTEVAVVTFGRAAAERALDNQPEPPVDAGPGPIAGPWSVLVGFVQWNASIGKFTKAVREAGGLRRRYVGVKADRVLARGGRLELRPDPIPEAGNLAVVLGGDPATLIVGVYNGSGGVDERVTITAKGDITAQGTIKGIVTEGEVRVQSGVASDGAILPLPPEITQQQLDDGVVVAHVMLSPHLGGVAAPSGAGVAIGPVAVECQVDSQRRLRCLLRWAVLDLSTTPLTVTERYQPGAADYALLVTVPAAAGASP